MTTNEAGQDSWASLSARSREAALFHSQRGQLILARPVAPSDADSLADLLASLSAGSLYLRYCMPMPCMAPEMAQREAARLGKLDTGAQLAAVALLRVEGLEQAIGVAELVRDSACPEIAEIAVVVADAYQREGIGSALCAYLVAAARGYGIMTVRAQALHENRAVRRMVANSGAAYTTETRLGMTTLQIDIRDRAQAGGTALLQ
jgi:acetyltransferase